MREIGNERKQHDVLHRSLCCRHGYRDLRRDWLGVFSSYKVTTLIGEISFVVMSAGLVAVTLGAPLLLVACVEIMALASTLVGKLNTGWIRPADPVAWAMPKAMLIAFVADIAALSFFLVPLVSAH